MEDKITVAVLGAGNIGTAMAIGLSHTASVRLWNRSAKRLADFGECAGVERCEDFKAAVAPAEAVFICVEGHAVKPVLRQLAEARRAAMPLVVSCAAAVSLAQMKEILAEADADATVARVLPNIAATVGESVNLCCVAGDTDIDLMRLLSYTGETYTVAEQLFGPAMALSSCGIAYALRYIRASMSAGVQMGLDPVLAATLAAGAMRGAATMLTETDCHPESLIDTVTTPGGLTIKGLNAMEAQGFSAAIIAGLLAAGTPAK